MEQKILEQSRISRIQQNSIRTTIAIRKGTKERLDNSRAHGQCYESFISELVEYWERYRIASSLCGPGKPIRQEAKG